MFRRRITVSSQKRSGCKRSRFCRYLTLICIGLVLSIAHAITTALRDAPINTSLLDLSIADITGEETAEILRHAFQPGEEQAVVLQPKQERHTDQQQHRRQDVQVSTTTNNTTTAAEPGSSRTDIAAKLETTNDNAPADDDADCIFRDSPLYRKIYVYPNPGEDDWNKGDILTEYGKNLTAMQWPWIALDKQARAEATSHYDVQSQNVQYATELLVRELMVNPKSCLRTYDPEAATLFYVPYLPSTEHHMAHNRKTDYSFSDYGKAIMEIIDNQEYEMWERLFGMTSKYWKRRGGADHILVFSEPMHGLYHPRNKRGNFHFIHSQKQLTPPIVISVELSSTFVNMYPNCAAKNILVPYPNTHGSWFNGNFITEAAEALVAANTTVLDSEAAIPAERKVAGGRPVAQFYKAGNHGTCTKLRRAMQQDFYKCAPSAEFLKSKLSNSHNTVGMRLSTFCPCPGGDSPSAKRMFDSLIAGCIPIILSEDFVWPFTKEFDSSLSLDPADFSIRLNAADYDTPLLDETSCQPVDSKRPGLQAYLESLPLSEIERLRTGVQKVGQLYSWYAENPSLPENPLRDGVLPDGGTAHFVVQALAERAEGVRWPACAEELKQSRGEDARQFKC